VIKNKTKKKRRRA